MILSSFRTFKRNIEIFKVLRKVQPPVSSQCDVSGECKVSTNWISPITLTWDLSYQCCTKLIQWRGEVDTSRCHGSKSRSRLLLLANFITCLPRLIPCDIAFIPSILKRVQRCWVSWVRPIRLRMFTSYIKRRMREFHVVVVQWRHRNVPKLCCECKTAVMPNKYVAFLTFLMSSRSLNLLDAYLC